MRNLVTTRHSAIRVNSTTAPDKPISAATWDPSTDSVICTLGPCSQDSVVELWRVETNGEVSFITSWDPSESCDYPNNHIILLRHFPDTLSTCIVFSGGFIVLVRENSSPKIEIVGSIDEGIHAAAWSPDEEALAIYTGSSVLLFMTRNFEPIADVTLSAQDASISQHVSVGWGRSETQFKGKRARAMRDPTVPETIDQGILSASDDGKVHITWRGDGAFLALSTVEEQARRLIRVYSREGVLESVSEPVDGLEGCLDWRPSGSLIAGIQHRPDRRDVVFFEKNGLRHGEFSLDPLLDTSTESVVGELAWNGDSSILAIYLRDRVQLWCTGNYHWYLKQETFMSGPSVDTDRSCILRWHPENPTKFFYVVNSTIVMREVVWKTVRGRHHPPNDYGLIIVVDRNTLNLTPLRIANVPPPMAHSQLALSQVPLDVSISSDGEWIASLSQSFVELSHYSLSRRDCYLDPDLNFKIPIFQDGITYRQISFLGESTVGVLGDIDCEQGILRVFRFQDSGDVVHDQQHCLLGGTSSCSLRTIDDLGVFTYQSQTGEVFQYDPDTNKPLSIGMFPTPCPWMESRLFQGAIFLFGLSESGRLYVNQNLIASGCTSYMVTDTHLVFTTSHHVLKFVHLTLSVEDFKVPPDDPTDDERCRSIERGARLVQVVPSKCSVTLQMPRGNLETIYPRALVLSGIRNSIDLKQYLKAFLACRTHRVDFNILCDHNIDQFIASVGLFVEQLKKPEYIDLFLSQLREENVSTTMYQNTLPEKAKMESQVLHRDSSTLTKSKVNTVCDTLAAFLLRELPPTHIQNIITAYVSKIPADYESALSLVASLSHKDNIDAAELAIQHICFLSDVNMLFDTALGLYNLELALNIAQQSQKDPREYLPFLQGLEEMEILRRKFTIDNYLRRHSKALAHLHSMGANNFAELQRYVVEHELYRTALGLYRHAEEDLKSILKLYAKYLEKNLKLKEAALICESLGDYLSAVEIYRRAGNWREALFCADEGRLDTTSINELSLSLAEALWEAKDYESAARIYLDHRGDVREGVRALCKGSQFAEAMRVVTLHRKHELVSEVIEPALQETFASVTEFLGECKGQLGAQVKRLRELRLKKLEDPLSYFDGIVDDDVADNVSVAPTNASTSTSLFTRYTEVTGATAMTGDSRRTSKNRKREERKRARGKKGSVYEEEYLVNSIGRLIDRLNSTRLEGSHLIEGLVRRTKREQAFAVQFQIQELITQIQDILEEVFENEETRREQQSLVTAFDGLSFL